jgi:hypothetical protein
MLVEEVSDGPGEAWQEFAVGPSAQAVLGSLDHLLGRESLLCGGGGAAELEQAGDVSYRKAGLTVEEKMTEQADRVIVVSAVLQEGKSRVQDGALGVGEAGLGDGGILQPTGEVRSFGDHDTPLGTSGDRSSVWRCSWKFTQKARKTIWC